MIRRVKTKKAKKKAGWFKTFLTKKILDFSNKLIIKRAKKDLGYRQFVENFRATLQFSTQDGRIHRYIVFDGKGGIIYRKGEALNPDAMILYHSVKDMFKVLISLGDVVQAILNYRFELRGNLCVIFKYQFLTSYYNPKLKKIPKLKKKLLASLNDKEG